MELATGGRINASSGSIQCSWTCLRPRLFNISCSEYVERHLECSFYNHAALTPADWSTYCQLASLAHERLGLHVPAPALPEHKLSEGVPPCLQSPPCDHYHCQRPKEWLQYGMPHVSNDLGVGWERC